MKLEPLRKKICKISMLSLGVLVPRGPQIMFSTGQISELEV